MFDNEQVTPDIIGPFTQYEKPNMAQYTHQDENGDNLSMVGFTCKAFLKYPDGTIEELAASGDEEGVEVTWPTAGLSQVGTYFMEIWMDNSTLRYCSNLFAWTCRPALDDPS